MQSQMQKENENNSNMQKEKENNSNMQSQMQDLFSYCVKFIL